ncbi:hypothetical protein [Stenotrophomonas sp. SY1]|uniref:hypothetical protein n=1 Tax=Stenotrophomonas sp. SY1 TaxID=477235 RepID=UPI001E2AB58D|nr:hypothetical protein [Stenotrophomonas sp. SY1]MCD9088151.1 hypothetical protein [Stenotrophomonas sp. SY1]
MAALTACQSRSQNPSSENYRQYSISLISVYEVQRDETSSQVQEATQVCPQWKMTKESAFFVLSESQPIDPQAYFRELNTAPCKVTGELLSDGNLWRFTINAGSGVIWSRGDEHRYFACMADACDALMLMPYPRLGDKL